MLGQKKTVFRVADHLNVNKEHNKVDIINK